MYSIMVAAVGFTLWFGLLQKVDMNEVTLFRLTIPVIGSIVSALVLPEETITINIAVALLFVFIGMYFVNRPDRRKEENLECVEVHR
jgi:drug/metabolite transporter (DMT)-like permease